MRLKTFLSTLLLTLIYFPSFGQWTEVATFNQRIKGFEVFENKLYLAGNFTAREGNLCYWSCSYDGSTFTDQTTIISGGGLIDIADFNGKLYGVGSMNINSYTGVSIWEDPDWTSDPYFTVSHSSIFVDGNDLYVGSDLGIVSKKTGANEFISLPPMDNNSDVVFAINKYNDEIIIAGYLDSFNDVPLNNIARFNDGEWKPLTEGTLGTVRCLAVYNSELYVGGTFNLAGGNNLLQIAKWDGTNWSDVGGSVTGSGTYGVRDMKVFDGKLYVAGDFTEMGGVDAKYLAVWDGANWSALSLDVSNSFVDCLTVYQGDIYVGTFDFDNSKLYTNKAVTSIDDISNQEINIMFYPNPVHDVLNVSLENFDRNFDLEIRDLNGFLRKETSLSEQEVSIDCSVMMNGLYFAIIKDSQTGALIHSQRFLKF